MSRFAVGIGDGWVLCRHLACRASSPAVSRLVCPRYSDTQLQAVARSTTAMKRRIPSETPSACHRLASSFPTPAVVVWVDNRFAILRSYGFGIQVRHTSPWAPGPSGRSCVLHVCYGHYPEVRMGVTLWTQRYIHGWTAAFGFVTVPILESWRLPPMLCRCFVSDPVVSGNGLSPGHGIKFTECDGCNPIFSRVVELWPECWKESAVQAFLVSRTRRQGQYSLSLPPVYN
jgi:hypothetical protein